MLYNPKTLLRRGLATALLVVTTCWLTACGSSEKRTESQTTSDPGNTMGLGRTGDTTTIGQDPMAPQQAPPDSAQNRGATVPANVKVTGEQ